MARSRHEKGLAALRAAEESRRSAARATADGLAKGPDSLARVAQASVLAWPARLDVGEVGLMPRPCFGVGARGRCFRLVMRCHNRCHGFAVRVTDIVEGLGRSEVHIRTG